MYYMNLIDLICFVTGVCLMNCHMNRQSVVVFIMCVCVCVRACVRASICCECAHIQETLLQAVIQHHFYCTRTRLYHRKIEKQNETTI